jgi:hypothetical protein
VSDPQGVRTMRSIGRVCDESAEEVVDTIQDRGIAQLGQCLLKLGSGVTGASRALARSRQAWRASLLILPGHRASRFPKLASH